MKKLMMGVLAIGLAFGICDSTAVFAAGMNTHLTATVAAKQLHPAMQSASPKATAAALRTRPGKDPAGGDCSSCTNDDSPRVPQVMGSW